MKVPYFSPVKILLGPEAVCKNPMIAIMILALTGCAQQVPLLQPDDSNLQPNDPIPGVIFESSFAETNFSSESPTEADELSHVLVAVLDTEFRLTHEQFTSRIAGTSNFDATVTMDDGVYHGTGVAALVVKSLRTPGGAEVGIANDAMLWPIKVTNDENATLSNLQSGVMEASRQRAHVVNLSWSNGLSILNNQAVKEAVLNASKYDELDEPGMAVVMAAGNRGEALTAASNTLSRDFSTAASYKDFWVMVGGSQAPDSAGDPRHPNSNFPGLDADLQKRFVLAPYENITAGNTADNAYVISQGTSLSAPLVSGMLAEISTRWRHLKMNETLQVLLETADRSSPLYEQDCRIGRGPPQSRPVVNCGDYHLGRGVANLERALNEPVGETTMATSDTLSEGLIPLSESSVVWSEILSMASHPNNLTDMVQFDELGRDVPIRNLSWGAAPSAAQRLNRRLEYLTRAQHVVASGGLNTYTDQTLQLWYQADRLQAAALSGQSDTFHWQAGFFLDPLAKPNMTQTRLLLSDPISGLHQPMQQGLSLNLESHLSAHVKAAADWVWGHSNAGVNSAEVSQFALQARLSRSLLNQIRLDFLYAHHGERGAVLGSVGQGAFRLPEHAGLQEWGLGLSWPIGFGLSWSASHFWGAMSDTLEDGFFQLSDVRTARSQVALAATSERHSWHLQWVQPLALTAGALSMNVPVGRTVSGQVMREQREINLVSQDNHQHWVLNMDTLHDEHQYRIQAIVYPALESPVWGLITEWQYRF